MNTKSKTNTIVDKKNIASPTILFTERAFLQLKTIIENDFTLAGKYFRILISGKGCDGFTYSAGFTDLHVDDFEVKVTNIASEELHIIIDPFAAFYLQNASVDFIQDFVLDTEGFVVVNHAQEEFHNKFFNTNPEKIPPLLDLENLNA
jgi:Fe-S cluster assembly iron-binding protein IscA